MVEKLKNRVMQNIAIVITIMIIISTAVLSCFVSDNIEKILDKIVSYLGILAIPLVIWYFNIRKEKEENLRKEEQKIQTINEKLSGYRNSIITFLKKTKEAVPSESIDDTLKNMPINSEEDEEAYRFLAGSGGGQENLAIKEINSKIPMRCQDSFPGKDLYSCIELLVFLNIIRREEGLFVFCERLYYDIEEIHQYFEKLIEKVENGEYDSNIREFIEREI